MYHPDNCTKGCGRRTSNKTGICPKCRTKKCVTCGTEFVWRDIESCDCVKCASAKRREVNYEKRTSYGGIW